MQIHKGGQIPVLLQNPPEVSNIQILGHFIWSFYISRRNSTIRTKKSQVKVHFQLAESGSQHYINFRSDIVVILILNYMVSNYRTREFKTKLGIPDLPLHNSQKEKSFKISKVICFPLALVLQRHSQYSLVILDTLIKRKTIQKKICSRVVKMID